jgi:hypothetical protein
MYQIRETARYAHVSPKTVAAWHKVEGRSRLTRSKKDLCDALSYFQSIEVAVVAAFRKKLCFFVAIAPRLMFVANATPRPFIWRVTKTKQFERVPLT